jgi:alkylation response protein AidB-like acyl-CoA dehydrogenase
MTVHDRPVLANFPAEVRKFLMPVREFARDEVAPQVREFDTAPPEEFTTELVQKGHDLGLTRALIPAEHGGLGVGVTGLALALEELAAACPDLALIFGATMLGQLPVLLAGDRWLRARFLPLFAGDEAVLACNAVARKFTGPQLVKPENPQWNRPRPAIRREDGDYVVNGAEQIITNAKTASFASVFASIEGSAELTCLIVPLDSPGVHRDLPAGKRGYRARLTGSLRFDEVRIPSENLIGGEHRGDAVSTAQLNLARSALAAISTGIARHALELSLQWCGQQVRGITASNHQLTARKLADMASSVEAARLLYLAAASKVDTGYSSPEYEPAVAKFFADRVAVEVAGTAVSLLGSQSTFRAFGIEAILRNSYGARIHEGMPEELATAITDCLYRNEDDHDNR